MHYNIDDITTAIGGKLLNQKSYDLVVTNIVFDTRKISFHEQSIFVALTGKSDGHNYISKAYDKGIRNFIVSKRIDISAYPKANFIYCSDTLQGLQLWARHHRNIIGSPVIAITGSNGKTIVKEWLAQALETKYRVSKSPLSYNSQLGVALSVLQLDQTSELNIIEAGISKKNEMATLREMIQPLIGILTNLGDAHSEGFETKEEKLREKLLLFADTQMIIYNKDLALVDKMLSETCENKSISWGQAAGSDIQITSITELNKGHLVDLTHGVENFQLTLPFTSSHRYENCMQVVSYLILDNWSNEEIQEAINNFSTLPNRMEIKQGVNGCLIIDDSYSSDLTSMQLALEQLELLSDKKERILILTPFEQQRETTALNKRLATLISTKNIDKVIGIGFPKETPFITKGESYLNTDDFIIKADHSQFQKAAILIKGARKYTLDKISNYLAEQVHQTQLETNLSATTNNLNFYRSLLQPTTKIMAVVKAEAYGSGSTQMTKFLEQQKVDYLAVALIDEAVQLRKQNCKLPIMIFNVQEDNLDQLWAYKIEPEIYGTQLLRKLSAAVLQAETRIKIHLKIDSGMHRLGFVEEEIPELIEFLKTNKQLEVASIFSHLASSEQSVDDDFTRKQLEQFDKIYETISSSLQIQPLKHILNTAGIVRFPDQQYDMVRLGLGLYGIDESKTVQSSLEKAHTLKAKVLQLKALKTGHSTGYNRSGSSDTDTMIAVVSIGYADGIMRAAGNGNHHFSINGNYFPTIGNICMDVMMLNVGQNSQIIVGDEVVIFGPNDPIESLAKSCNTITYEIISRIAPRVKRTYTFV